MAGIDQEKRSRLMSRIGSKDTGIEFLVRKALFARGFRYRLHGKAMPGRPDLVFRKYRAVVFVNGCFWHGHDCSLFRLPKTRTEFWRSKIGATRARDARNRRILIGNDWRVLTIWECALRGRTAEEIRESIEEISTWLKSHRPVATIPYVPPAP
jgi:DNA mismatch endonuclease, patch repair protein